MRSAFQPVSIRLGIVAFATLLASGSPTLNNREALVRATISEYMSEYRVVGCSVAIAEKGTIVFQSGFGFADLENPTPAKPETVYRLASISKSLTATAVMKLVEAGKVNLDEDVRKYVPEFPPKDYVFTVRQVLSHQSGIRHYKGVEFESRKHYETLDEALAIFKDDPLVAAPGTEYRYSTYGYTLLAKLVERVSGQSFRDFIRSQICEPAGMAQTGVEDLKEIVPNRARGYRETSEGKLYNSDFADLSYKWGGGGMISSAPDLCRFGMALLQGKLLSPHLRRTMWTPSQLIDGKWTTYGNGFNIGLLGGKQMISHSGAQQGAQSMLLIFPEEETVIAILSNFESHRAGIMGRKVAGSWFGVDPVWTALPRR
jgi:CubicO group peptidase (beta-lactamase class C family)